MCLAAELAVRADFARDARDFGREYRELLDHRVDDRCGAEEFAFQGTAVDVEPHRPQQIALCDGGDRPGDFGSRTQEVVNQRIDRVLHFAPGAMSQAQLDALVGQSFFADDLSYAIELPRHALVGRYDIIENVGDFSGQAVPVRAQPHAKVPAAHGLQGVEHFDEHRIRSAYDVLGSDRADLLRHP